MQEKKTFPSGYEFLKKKKYNKNNYERLPGQNNIGILKFTMNKIRS